MKSKVKKWESKIETKSLKVFNVEALAELIEIENGGETGLIKSLIDDYQENATKLLQEVREETAKKDAKQVEGRLHSLRSSSALLGLEKLAKMAGDLEDLAETSFPREQELLTLDATLKEGLQSLLEFKPPSAELPS